MVAAGQVVVTVEEQETVDGPPELLRGGRLDLYPQVAKRNYFQVRIGPDGLKIQAGNFVGVIPINDSVTLRVTPRVPLRNLAHLLNTTNHSATVLPGLFRDYDTEAAIYPSLVALYASSLRRLIESVTQGGLLRRYFRREEDNVAPRGRINVTRTLQTAGAKRSPAVSTSYFERSADTPENQALLAAVIWLHRYVNRYAHVLGDSDIRRIRWDLNRSRLLLRGVSVDSHLRALEDPVVIGKTSLPALRQDYRPVLDLAVAILRQQAVVIDHAGHRLQLETLLIDMDSVFEKYMREVIRTAARHEGWLEEILDGNHRGPQGGASQVFSGHADDYVETNPDIVCRRPGGERSRFPLIIDAKYRPLGQRVRRDDLEQVLTYGLAYRSQRLLILQPRGEGGKGGLRKAGEVQGTTVYAYGFDLSGDLPAEEASLAAAVRGLCDSVLRAHA